MEVMLIGPGVLISIACFEMEEFESAKDAFEASRAISDSATVRRWIRKCEAEIEEDGSEEEEVAAPGAMGVAQPIPTLTSEEAKQDPLPPAKPSARHEWYQSPTAVTITIFAKNIKQDQCTIEPTASTVRKFIINYVMRKWTDVGDSWQC